MDAPVPDPQDLFTPQEIIHLQQRAAEGQIKEAFDQLITKIQCFGQLVKEQKKLEPIFKTIEKNTVFTKEELELVQKENQLLSQRLMQQENTVNKVFDLLGYNYKTERLDNIDSIVEALSAKYAELGVQLEKNKDELDVQFEKNKDDQLRTSQSLELLHQRTSNTPTEKNLQDDTRISDLETTIHMLTEAIENTTSRCNALANRLTTLENDSIKTLKAAKLDIFKQIIGVFQQMESDYLDQEDTKGTPEEQAKADLGETIKKTYLKFYNEQNQQNTQATEILFRKITALERTNSFFTWIGGGVILAFALWIWSQTHSS